MNVYLATLGCRLNEAELATWTRELDGRGHRVVAEPGAAHLMVVNTCAVTAEAARKSRKLIGALHRRSPEARVVLTGCYASLAPERAAALAGVDLVIDNRDKDDLIGRIERDLVAGEMPAVARDADSAGFRAGRTRAFVKVQDGCRNRCTFCIVTVARGDERSGAITDVVDEIRELVARGHREAVLTGVHLGGYGSDLDTDLRALVRAVLADTDIERLRLSSLEPWDLPADFHRLWEDARLMPHVHLPLQSGCDATLKRMARRCPTRRYRELVERLREHVPGLTVTTDLIVGFPGETDAEWAETMATVADLGFAHVHIFAYSARDGTAAARMRGAVPRAIARARSRQAHDLAAVMKAAVLERSLGTERAVLWEGRGEPVGRGRLRFEGYTDNYLRVETEIDGPVDLDNYLAPAELVAVGGNRIKCAVRAPAGGWPEPSVGFEARRSLRVIG